LEYPLADLLIELFMTIVILRIIHDTGKSVLFRMLSGVAPGIVDKIQQVVNKIKKVKMSLK